MTKTQFATEAQRRRDEGLMLFGGFAVKDEVKAAGGIFDGRLKCWLIPSADVADELGLVAKEGRHGAYLTVAKTAASPAASPAPRQSHPALYGGVERGVTTRRGECESRYCTAPAKYHGLCVDCHRDNL